jgi:hypothetical protein
MYGSAERRADCMESHNMIKDFLPLSSDCSHLGTNQKRRKSAIIGIFKGTVAAAD